MSRSSPIAVVTDRATPTAGAFRGEAAVRQGVSRKQLATPRTHGAIERLFSDTYRLTAALRTHDQLLHAALLWAGDRAEGDGGSAGVVYGLEGVRAEVPTIVGPTGLRRSSKDVVVHHCDDRRSLMVRTVRGLRVTGVEATRLRLAPTSTARRSKSRVRTRGVGGSTGEFPLVWDGRT